MNLPALLIEILLIAAGTAAVCYLIHLTAEKLKQRKGLATLPAISRAIKTPAIWITAIFGLFLLIEAMIRRGACIVAPDFLNVAKQMFFVGAATWLLLLWKNEVVKALIKKAGGGKTDMTLISMMGKLSTIAILIVAGFMVLDILSVPLQALLAFGGLGSLAISWAAKDVIANFFGGMMIYMNRPFAEGDWIMSPNKNFEGVVEEIGWYMTRIRTFERRPTYLPNALITDAIVENPGRMYNRRIKTTVGIRYCDIDKVEEIIEKIRKMLREHPEIDQRQFLFVHFVEFGAYSLDINIYTFTKTTKWELFRNIQQDVLLKVSTIISSCGAEIAFPTRTLHMAKD